MTRRDRLTALTAANTDDLLRAFRLPDRPLLRLLARPPARRFAGQLQRLDTLVASDGLAAGARWALRTFSHRLTTIGRDRVPADGPLLAVANHPGLTDVMALVLALEMRDDLLIVALDRPMLRSLPTIAARLLWVSDGDRLALIVRARQHLRSGGALLTFPAGGIEPDPTLREAHGALQHWSPSAATLTRGIDGLNVLPLAVGGVISAAALASPPARRLTDRKDREFAAATLQVLFRRYRDTDTRVLVGEPITPGADLTTDVRRRMSDLLTQLAVLGVSGTV